jgi:hypothetical protein
VYLKAAALQIMQADSFDSSAGDEVSFSAASSPFAFINFKTWLAFSPYDRAILIFAEREFGGPAGPAGPDPHRVGATCSKPPAAAGPPGRTAVISHGGAAV